MFVGDSPTDVIFVDGVTRNLMIGQDAWGRQAPQIVKFSARIFSKRVEGGNDDVKRTLDYTVLYDILMKTEFSDNYGQRGVGMALAIAIQIKIAAILGQCQGEVEVSLPKATKMYGATLSVVTSINTTAKSPRYISGVSMTNALLHPIIGVTSSERTHTQPVIVSVQATDRSGNEMGNFQFDQLPQFVSAVCGPMIPGARCVRPDGE